MCPLEITKSWIQKKKREGGCLARVAHSTAECGDENILH